MLTKHWAEIWL